MKTLSLFSFLFLFHLHLASAQAFDWVRTGGGIGNDKASAVVADSAGNTYTAGTFSSTMTVGNTQVAPATGANASGFLACHNAAGVLQWVRVFGAFQGLEVHSLIIGSAGELYLTGEFQGSFTIGTLRFQNAGMQDLFLLKYTSTGALQWAKTFGGAGADGGSGLCALPDGDFVVTGRYEDSVRFGSFTLTSSGSTDIFIGRFNAAGQPLWLKAFGGANADYGMKVCTDGAGSIYATGTFMGTASFDNMQFTSFNNSTDVFTLRLSPTGTLNWVQRAGGSQARSVSGIGADAAGNVFVTGTYNGATVFETTVLVSHGNNDFFLAKYTAAGQLVLARSIGGQGPDQALALAVAPSGRVYVTGSLSGLVEFYVQFSSVFPLYLISNGPLPDVFVACFDNSLQPLWAQRAGGTAEEAGLALAVNEAGEVWVAGQFSGNAQFESSNVSSQGAEDFFLARIRTAPAIFTTYGHAATLSFCPGSGTDITFSSNTTFNPGNVFTAQLSDANGSFAVPIVMGTRASTSATYFTGATFPLNTPPGTGYRFRVVSSNPAIVGADNGQDITIFGPMLATVSPAGPLAFCQGAGTALTATTGNGIAYTWLHNGTGITGATGASYVPVQSGSYQVMIESSRGNLPCSRDTSAAVQITVHPLPVVQLPALASVCSTATAFPLTGGTPAGGVYSGPGVSGNSFDPTLAGPGTHAIVYSFTSPDGCTASGTATLLVNNCVSAPDILTGQALRLFPNPTSGMLQVELQNTASAPAQYRLLNLLGQEVVPRQTFPAKEPLLDLRHLRDGVYLLQLHTEGGMVAGKVVLQR